MQHSPRICRYLHIPAQSGSDAVLRAMNRGYTVAEYLDFIDRARAFLDQPEIGRPLMIAGDIISGFCGETEADHEATKRLLERARYKNCFIFRYSPRPGTAAFDRLADDVPEADKRRRVNELLALQQRISDEISRSRIGSTLDVFVQGVSAHQKKKQKRAQAPGGVALTIGGRGVDEPTGTAPAAPEQPAQPIQMSGRTDGDLIVVFPCPPGTAPDSLIGRILPVAIEGADTLTLQGIPVI